MATSDAYSGPHVTMVVLCERVLQEQDGVLSVIRIIDQMTQTATGPDAPDQMPPFLLDTLTMVITVKSDQARGRHAIKLRPEAPGGIQLPPMEQAITLQSGATGVNLIIPLVLPISQEGVYWFDILLAGREGHEDRLLTRVPLEVIYSPQKLPSA
jgi:hypothetical protein